MAMEEPSVTPEMKLPLEIINEIIHQGAGNCKTLSSWIKLSSYFKNHIVQTTGLILIQDGSEIFSEDSFPDFIGTIYKSLNSCIIKTDEFNEMTLKRYLEKFENLILIITSTRNYSDPLTVTLGFICRHVQKNSKLSVIYKTNVNYLSRLYFRELLFNKNSIEFCEIYIIGNKQLKEENTCDICTIFEQTYIVDIRYLLSLDIQDEDHDIYSEDLTTIRSLNIQATKVDVHHLLRNCTSLKEVISCNPPLAFESDIYHLPKCNKFALEMNNRDLNYLKIDGSAISEELSISPSLRKTSVNLEGLDINNINTLTFKLKDSMLNKISLKDCNFQNLKTLNVGSTIVPWSDLIASGVRLENLSLSLTTIQQYNWVIQCPFKLKLLKITSSIRIFSLYPLPLGDCENKLDIETLELDFQSLWQCYLLNEVFSKKLSKECTLKLKIPNDFYDEELKQRLKISQHLNIPEKDGNILLNVPEIKKLMISVEREGTYSGQKRRRSSASTVYSVSENEDLLNPVNIYQSSIFFARDFLISPLLTQSDDYLGVLGNLSRRTSTVENENQIRIACEIENSNTRLSEQTDSTAVQALQVTKENGFFSLLFRKSVPEIVEIDSSSFTIPHFQWVNNLDCKFNSFKVVYTVETVSDNVNLQTISETVTQIMEKINDYNISAKLLYIEVRVSDGILDDGIQKLLITIKNQMQKNYSDQLIKFQLEKIVLQYVITISINDI